MGIFSSTISNQIRCSVFLRYVTPNSQDGLQAIEHFGDFETKYRASAQPKKNYSDVLALFESVCLAPDQDLSGGLPIATVNNTIHLDKIFDVFDPRTGLCVSSARNKLSMKRSSLQRSRLAEIPTTS